MNSDRQLRKRIYDLRGLERKCFASRRRYAFYEYLAAVFELYVQLRQTRQDGYLMLLGPPVPAIQAVEAKEPVSFIGLTPLQMDAIGKALPEFSPSKIAAGTYRALEKDYSTIGVYSFAVGRADLPDDLVYQLVKAVFENQPRLLKTTSAASETVPQNVDKNTFLPFHPGAVRYYREIGISIPDLLVHELIGSSCEILVLSLTVPNTLLGRADEVIQ